MIFKHLLQKYCEDTNYLAMGEGRRSSLSYIGGWEVEVGYLATGSFLLPFFIQRRLSLSVPSLSYCLAVIAEMSFWDWGVGKWKLACDVNKIWHKIYIRETIIDFVYLSGGTLRSHSVQMTQVGKIKFCNINIAVISIQGNLWSCLSKEVYSQLSNKKTGERDVPAEQGKTH